MSKKQIEWLKIVLGAAGWDDWQILCAIAATLPVRQIRTDLSRAVGLGFGNDGNDEPGLTLGSP